MNKNVLNAAIMGRGMADGMGDKAIDAKGVVMSSKTNAENGRQMSSGTSIVMKGIRIIR